MAKPEQILIIDPQGELRFRGPFAGSPVTSYIKLINPTKYKVYFKIKTTAPKRYCVRPNSGALKPKEVIEIAVCLQPHDFDPMEKNKHKFMVQTLIAPDNADDEYPNDVWKDTDPNALMDTKLKCVFENPVTNSITTKSTVSITTSKSNAISNNDKNKGTGDLVKPPPKAITETNEKLLRAAQEVNQLRVEESTLRQENLQLKEDLLRWQSAVREKEANQTSSNNQWPLPTSVIIAIAMIIVGYLLGKMI